MIRNSTLAVLLLMSATVLDAQSPGTSRAVSKFLTKEELAAKIKRVQERDKTGVYETSLRELDKKRMRPEGMRRARVYYSRGDSLFAQAVGSLLINGTHEASRCTAILLAGGKYITAPARALLEQDKTGKLALKRHGDWSLYFGYQRGAFAVRRWGTDLWAEGKVVSYSPPEEENLVLIRLDKPIEPVVLPGLEIISKKLAAKPAATGSTDTSPARPRIALYSYAMDVSIGKGGEYLTSNAPYGEAAYQQKSPIKIRYRSAPVIQLSGFAYPGSNGGAVVQQIGDRVYLVGIVTAVDSHRKAFAVHARQFRKRFLEIAPIPPRPKSPHYDEKLKKWVDEDK